MFVRPLIKKVTFLVVLTVMAIWGILTTVDVVTHGTLSRIVAPVVFPNAPNIVLVVVDTLRADHLSQYGYERETSPGLDRFASEALIFDNAYSTSSWTIPATASIMTGLHPARHRTTERGDKLPNDIRTIAEQLKRAGYETAGFSDNIHISRKTDFDQGFDTFFDLKADSALAYPDMAIMMKNVRSWVRRHEKSERPFFLYMQPMNCHGPYKVPRSHETNLLSKRPSRKFRYYRQPMADIMWRGKVKKRKAVDKAYLKSLVDQYDTAVRYSTDRVGELFAFLREAQAWENTLVVFTADHGEELFDHGGFSHGYSLYNEVVNVPLMIKLPSQSRSRRAAAVVSVMDIFPTVSKALNIGERSHLDGRSVLPLFDDVNNSLYIDTRGLRRSFRNRALLLSVKWKERAVAKGWVNRKHKFIDVARDYSGRRQARLLYNLKTDPREKRNLYGRDKRLARRLRKAVADRWRLYAENALRKGKNVLKDLNVDALKALGYIQ